MPLEQVQIKKIVISENRMRKNFDSQVIIDMQEEFSKPQGMINPITLIDKGDTFELITGETRFRAVKALAEIGIGSYYNGADVPAGFIMATVYPDTLTELEKLEIEFSENVLRAQFTLAEKTSAEARLIKLRQIQLNVASGKLDASQITEETVDNMSSIEVSLEAKMDIAKATYGEVSPSAVRKMTDTLTIDSALKSGGDLAKELESATSTSQALKMIDRHSRKESAKILAQTVGTNFSNKMHTLIKGDAITEMRVLHSSGVKFTCCLTDPPYGIGADNFANAPADGAVRKLHSYDDSLASWQKFMPLALKGMTALMEREAHVYLFCDIRRFPLLANYLSSVGDPDNPWEIAQTPIIMPKPPQYGLVPNPGFTPRRTYEVILFAWRGKKREYGLIPDVLPTSQILAGTLHGAEKPIDVLEILLKRSCLAGDHVLDFTCGSGSVFEAAHNLKIKATGIEIDETSFGLSTQRIKKLI